VEMFSQPHNFPLTSESERGIATAASAAERDREIWDQLQD